MPPSHAHSIILWVSALHLDFHTELLWRERPAALACCSVWGRQFSSCHSTDHSFSVMFEEGHMWPVPLLLMSREAMSYFWAGGGESITKEAGEAGLRLRLLKRGEGLCLQQTPEQWQVSRLLVMTQLWNQSVWNTYLQELVTSELRCKAFEWLLHWMILVPSQTVLTS